MGSTVDRTSGPHEEGQLGCTTTPPRGKYVVRYREDGRRRTARFDTPEEAEAFERSRGAAADTAPSDPATTRRRPQMSRGSLSA
jgi:hypothetical protein